MKRADSNKLAVHQTQPIIGILPLKLTPNYRKWPYQCPIQACIFIKGDFGKVKIAILTNTCWKSRQNPTDGAKKPQGRLSPPTICLAAKN